MREEELWSSAAASDAASDAASNLMTTATATAATSPSFETRGAARERDHSARTGFFGERGSAMKRLFVSDQREYRDKPIRTERWLLTWLEEFLVCACRPFPSARDTQAPLDYMKHAYFRADEGRGRVGAARRWKTRMGAAATLLDLLHKPGVQARILGGSLEQSKRMWQHLLEDAKQPECRAGPRGMRRTASTARAAGRTRACWRSRSARCAGLRVQKLRCDESGDVRPRRVGGGARWSRAARARRGVRDRAAVIGQRRLRRPWKCMSTTIA
jgi:hypothetical protein